MPRKKTAAQKKARRAKFASPKGSYQKLTVKRDKYGRFAFLPMTGPRAGKRAKARSKAITKGRW